MGDVVRFYAVGQHGQTEQLSELFHGALRPEDFAFLAAAVFFQRVVCIGMRKFEELPAHPLFGLDHTHGAVRKPADRPFQRVRILRRIRDYLVAHGRIFDIKLIDIGRYVLVRGVEHAVFAAHQLAAAHHQHIHRSEHTVGFVGEYVEVEILWQRAHLLAHYVVEDFELVFVVQGDFEVFLVRKREHLLGENALDLPVVAAQEGYHPLYLFLVLLRAHAARAGSETPAQMIVEAGTRGFGHIAAAIAHLERRVNEVGYVAHVHGLHIGAEILRAVVSQFAHQPHGGKILAHIYAQERIRLVVFEEYVVLGGMLFDEVVFRDQRVHFARTDDVAEIGDVFEHRHNLRGLVAGLIKILFQTRVEPLRLADVDNFARLVQHHINAGILRHVFQLRLEVHGDIIPHPERLVNK